MQLTQVECFVAVADAASFRKAAAALNYSPSHVSQQVGQLEHELGVRLFVRSTHDVEVSDAGRRLLPLCRDLLELRKEITTMAGAIASGERRRLAIAYSSGSWTAASRVLDAFAAEHHDTDIALLPLPNEELVAALRSGEAAVGFVLATRDVAPDLRSFALFDFPQDYLTINPANPLAQRDSLVVEDIRGQTLLLPAPDIDRMHGARILRFLAERGVEVEPRFQRFTNEEEVVDLVAAQNCVAFTGSTTYERWGTWPNVVIRPIEGPVPTLVQLVVWSSARGAAAVGAFLATARAVYGVEEADEDDG